MNIKIIFSTSTMVFDAVESMTSAAVIPLLLESNSHELFEMKNRD